MQINSIQATLNIAISVSICYPSSQSYVNNSIHSIVYYQVIKLDQMGGEGG